MKNTALQQEVAAFSKNITAYVDQAVLALLNAQLQSVGTKTFNALPPANQTTLSQILGVNAKQNLTVIQNLANQLSLKLDFPNAQLPSLMPLQKSVAQGNFETEDQLRQLFIELFDTLLARQTFDVNVSGMGHLGSLDLVRKNINADGLVLLRGDREESATRYICRAWKSRNGQGRGLHFLRTYLQFLFPNANGVEQLSQPKNSPYPSNLIPKIYATDKDYFLTSRILVLLDYDKVTDADIEQMSPILRDIVAARFVICFGKLVILQPKINVGCSLISGATVTVYPK